MRLQFVCLMAACAAFPGPALAEDRVPVGPLSFDRTEVTVGQFRAFAESTGLQTTAEREGGGFEFGAGWERRPGWTYLSPYGQPAAGNEPAVHISWAEARDYCAWAGGRLPTRAEWENAAYTEQRTAPSGGFVSGQVYEYPVGNSPEGMNNSRERHVAVATTKEGVNGLYDMGANVWEWLADRQGGEALTAGGSWWYGPENSRAGRTQWKPAEFYALYVGFRCVYDADG